MTSRDFCYWLQGFFELKEEKGGPLTKYQEECIKKHLALVFVHEIDPSFPNKPVLDSIHNDSNQTYRC